MFFLLQHLQLKQGYFSDVEREFPLILIILDLYQNILLVALVVLIMLNLFRKFLMLVLFLHHHNHNLRNHHHHRHQVVVIYFYPCLLLFHKQKSKNYFDQFEFPTFFCKICSIYKSNSNKGKNLFLLLFFFKIEKITRYLISFSKRKSSFFCIRIHKI